MVTQYFIPYVLYKAKITSFLIISGARYSGVPQNVSVVSVPISPSLQNPKSVSTKCPSLSSNKFSGLRSL